MEIRQKESEESRKTMEDASSGKQKSRMYFLVGAAGDEASALVGLGGDTGDGVDLVGTSILVGSLLPLLGHGSGLLAT